MKIPYWLSGAIVVMSGVGFLGCSRHHGGSPTAGKSPGRGTGKSTTAPSSAVAAASKGGLAGFHGKCDWSGVKTVTQINPYTKKMLQKLTYRSGHLYGGPHANVDVSGLMGVMCNTGAISAYKGYAAGPGGNVDGRWFTASAGGRSGHVRIDKTTQDGHAVFVMENRSKSAVHPGSIFISQITVSAKTWLMISEDSGFVKGTDLQLSKSVADLIKGEGLTEKTPMAKRAMELHPGDTFSYQ